MLYRIRKNTKLRTFLLRKTFNFLVFCSFIKCTLTVQGWSAFAISLYRLLLLLFLLLLFYTIISKDPDG